MLELGQTGRLGRTIGHLGDPVMSSFLPELNSEPD